MFELCSIQRRAEQEAAQTDGQHYAVSNISWSVNFIMILKGRNKIDIHNKTFKQRIYVLQEKMELSFAFPKKYRFFSLLVCSDLNNL